MTKTQKNLELFVNNTIRGFELTLTVAKENDWNVVTLMNSMDADSDSVHGALMFAKIYEEKITDETMDKLMNKLYEAKTNIVNRFIYREENRNDIC